MAQMSTVKMRMPIFHGKLVPDGSNKMVPNKLNQLSRTHEMIP